MCEAKRYKSGKPNPRIDKCMRNAIAALSCSGVKILACCCGHSKYHMSIGYSPAKVNGEPIIFELFSGKMIRRKRKFYKRDKEGYYYIPEVIGKS